MDFRVGTIILASFLVTSAESPSAQESVKDVSAIRAIDAAYVSAVLARDWDGLAALLTPDAVVMPPNESAVVGRAANLSRFRSFNVASVEYAHTPVHVGAEHTVGYLQGTYTLRMTFPNVAQPFSDRGKYLWILRKQSNGDWLIERIIWNTDVPRGTLANNELQRTRSAPVTVAAALAAELSVSPTRGQLLWMCR